MNNTANVSSNLPVRLLGEPQSVGRVSSHAVPEAIQAGQHHAHSARRHFAALCHAPKVAWLQRRRFLFVSRKQTAPFSRTRVETTAAVYGGPLSSNGEQPLVRNALDPPLAVRQQFHRAKCRRLLSVRREEVREEEDGNLVIQGGPSGLLPWASTSPRHGISTASKRRKDQYRCVFPLVSALRLAPL